MAVLMLEPSEAELMYLPVDRICLTIDHRAAFRREGAAPATLPDAIAMGGEDNEL